MYLGDIEVFRTSTAEPTPDGIIWTFIKEMGQYNALWIEEQKIIFDLPNIVNDVYTGPLNTTLTATFFTVPDTRSTAGMILPISAKRSVANMGSAFTVPSDEALVFHPFPQNVERAVVSLAACGQQAEEFWYTNVFTSNVDTFQSVTGTLNGYSPFREIQLLIDGQLAGVSWPFPIIFTGGIVPGLWRPVVGIDAFDLRQHEIDITPWLPFLCDGAEHRFEIRVVGLDDAEGHASLSETAGSYWVVTGTIFLFLGKEGFITTGTTPSINAPTPEIEISCSIVTNATGANETLHYTTSVSRSISISSSLKTSRGMRTASWRQSLTYSSKNSLTSQGLSQITVQSTNGNDTSSSGYTNLYAYPLIVNSSFATFPGNGFGIKATISRGLTYNVFGVSNHRFDIQSFPMTTASVFAANNEPETIESLHMMSQCNSGRLSTTQAGSAEYLATKHSSYSFGNMTQDFLFEGADLNAPKNATIEFYKRHVVAVNSSITENQETLVSELIKPLAQKAAVQDTQYLPAPGERSVRSLLGRGPGNAKGSHAVRINNLED